MRQREDTTEGHSFDDVPVGGIGGDVLLSRRKALKLGGLATLGGALGLLSSPGVAQARHHRTLKLAAGVTGPADSSVDGTGDQRFAQTFIPSISGQIVKATIEIHKSGSLGDYLFQINDVANVVPNSIVFASTTVADRLVPDGISTVTATFATPVLLVASFPYALVVSRPGSDNCTVGTRSNDPYPNGDAFDSAGLTAKDPFNFIETQTGDTVDMVFSIYVKPL
jgi:hypothetical protein